LTKRTTNKREKGNPRKRGFPWYLWTAIGVVICVVLALIVFLYPFTPTSPVQTDVLKCAIVDQLYSVSPNPAFIDRITKEVESLGFTVDIYRTDDVTVDFYRQLPSHGYKLIIFRVHAGLLENEARRRKDIWLFTSEPYSRIRYYFAQLRNQVTAAKTTVSDEPVFAISSKFVTDCMRHNFANIVIINMGCAAFYSDEMAEAYIKRGASTYMAWDVSVGLDYVDDATMTLVDKLCSKGLTISQAVSETMKEKGPDPNNNAFLKYYPQTNANKTIQQLIE
jgi:hypothetical protein